MRSERRVRSLALLVAAAALLGRPSTGFTAAPPASVPPPSLAPSPAPAGDTVEEIQETTVGTLSGVDVGVANMWERDYTDGAGNNRKGLTARLDCDIAGETRRVVVGEGSVLELGGGRWEVIRLTKPPAGNGSVTLRLLPSP